MKAPETKQMRKHAGDAAQLLRLLSHPSRLLVVCELVGGERTAGQLVTLSGLSQSALSQHLAKLREAGLVATRQEAQTVHYRLANPDATRVVGLLHDIYCKR